MEKPIEESRPTPWACSKPTTGPATSASWKIRWNDRSLWKREHDFPRRTSRKDSQQGSAETPQIRHPLEFQRADSGSGIDLEKYIQELEKSYILNALEASDGVGTRAAELLKKTYRSFRHYSKKYNIR